MSTPYSNDNGKFSNKAHNAARVQIYPSLFSLPFSNLRFEDTLLSMGEKEKQYDGEMAIDRIVKVKPELDDLRPIGFTIQERFRKPRFAGFEDITITEWNPITNQQGELYKLQAQLFMYGYFDEYKNIFIDVVVFDIAKALMGICNKSLDYGRGVNPRTKQPFITIKFSALKKSNCMIYWLKETINNSQSSLFEINWDSIPI